MAQFVYKAKQGPQKIVDGVIEADTLDSAISKILSKGLSPIDVKGRDSAAKRKQALLPHPQIHLFFNRVPFSQLTFFTRQMSNLLGAGVPILRGLGIIERQTKHPRFKEDIQDIINVVRDGGSFSSALSKVNDVFPEVFINMVRAGEVAENLDVVMGRLAAFMERDLEVRSKVRSSLMYPVLLLTAGAGTVFVLLTWVIPKITVIFEDLSENLPLPTVLLIGLSQFLSNYWWAVVGLTGLLFFYFVKAQGTPNGRLWIDGLKLKVPFFGAFLLNAQMGRFARTLGTLLDSGVDIITALDSVYMVLDNTVLKNEIQEVSSRVVDGGGLADAVRQAAHFPETVVSMIAVGEESGDTKQGLYNLADYYEGESERFMKSITSLIEPVLILALGSVVFFIVIAILMPIFRMNMIIQ